MKNKLLLLIFGLCMMTQMIYSQVPSYVPTTGLVGYWPFNGNANDQSGNGLNGTVNGATLTTDRFGNLSSSYSFANGNQFISIPAALPNTFVNSMTYSLWYKEIPNADYVNIFNASGKPLVLSPSATSIRANDGNTFGVDASSPLLKVNNWKHICAVYQGQNISIYINGNLIKSDTTGFSAIIQYLSSQSIVGSTYLMGGQYPYTGLIDDIGIWNRALTQSEITAIYNGGTLLGSATHITNATCNLDINEWSYITITKGVNNQGQMYKNGYLIYEGSWLNLYYYWNRIDLGAVFYTSYNSWFNGQIDELRISNTVRTSAEILNNYKNNLPFTGDSNTLGLWHFDDANPAVLSSATGQNGVGTNTTVVSGKFGNSILFNGTSSRISINQSVPSQNITLEFWIKPIGNSNSWPISLYGTNTSGFGINTVCTTSSPTGASQQTVCSGSTIASLTATGTAVKWYAAASGSTTLLASEPLVDGTTYYATQTLNGCESILRLAVTATINSVNSPKADASQTLCSSSTIANLFATGTNIQWYSTITGGTPLASSTSLVSGTTYFASQTVNGCESTARAEVAVSLNNPTVSANNSTICPGQTTTLTASSDALFTSNFSIGSVGPSGGYVFYDQGSVINGWRYLEVMPYDVINTNDFGLGCYCNTISNTSNIAGSGSTNTMAWATAGCPTIASNFSYSGFSNWFIPSKDELNLMYTNLKTNNLGNLQNVQYWSSSPAGYGSCGINGGAWVQNFTNGTQKSEYRNGFQGSGNLRLVRQFATGTPFSSYLWSTGATTASISLNPTTTTQYWVDVTTNGVTCRKYITITVNSTTTPPSGSFNQIMSKGSTLSNLVIIGQNIQFYAAPFGGTPLVANTSLVNGITYYASQTINGCESQYRLPVIVQVTLSNEEFNTIKIIYNPNPVTDILNIKASTELKNAKIFDLLGQTILQQTFNSKEIQLNMSDFPAGAYFVIVESDDKKETFKIVKK